MRSSTPPLDSNGCLPLRRQPSESRPPGRVVGKRIALLRLASTAKTQAPLPSLGRLARLDGLAVHYSPPTSPTTPRRDRLRHHAAPFAAPPRTACPSHGGPHPAPSRERSSTLSGICRYHFPPTAETDQQGCRKRELPLVGQIGVSVFSPPAALVRRERRRLLAFPSMNRGKSRAPPVSKGKCRICADGSTGCNTECICVPSLQLVFSRPLHRSQ